MTINLAPPPGFVGLSPDLPVNVYQRNLPHWRQDGATYFVTFHLADALPRAKQNELASLRRDWEAMAPRSRTHAAWRRRSDAMLREIEAALDNGHGMSWFQQAAYAGEMQRALQHFDGSRYELGAYVVMPNHVHVVTRPFKNVALEREIGAMKNAAARFINLNEQRRGMVWQQESYDRIVRDVDHLHRVVQYIGNNPRRAGVPRELWARWINPRWRELGWEFHD